MSLEPVAPIEFKDRKTGLIVFGILTALLGALCALFVPLMLLGHAMSARTAGASQNFQALIPGLVMFTSLAIAFIWLGIGSMIGSTMGPGFVGRYILELVDRRNYFDRYSGGDGSAAQRNDGLRPAAWTT